MAVRLRLKRMGSRMKPTYRIVAADSRCARNGKFLELLGTYDPKKKDAPVTVESEKVMSWLKKGALPTDTVRSILSKQGIMKEFMSSKAPKKAKAKKTVAKKETKTVEKEETVKKEPAKKATKKVTKKETK